MKNVCIKALYMDTYPPVSLRIENALIRTNFSSHKRDFILVAARLLQCFKCGARTSFPHITLCGLRLPLSNLALSNDITIHSITLYFLCNHSFEILRSHSVLLCKLCLLLFLLSCFYHVSNLKNKKPQGF